MTDEYSHEGIVQSADGRLIQVQAGGSQPFATVEINPDQDQLYGLLIQALAGFADVYNAFLRIIDENGVHVLNVDSGGVDMTAQPASDIHMTFRNNDGSETVELSQKALTILSNAIGRIANLGAATGLALGAFVPSDNPNFSQMQIYYDDTPGAAKLRVRAKDANGATVTGAVNLT
jgi:hypothetical protein